MNAEVTLEHAPGVEVVAVVTLASVDALGLDPGQDADAVVKAGSVVVAVDG